MGFVDDPVATPAPPSAPAHKGGFVDDPPDTHFVGDVAPPKPTNIDGTVQRYAKQYNVPLRFARSILGIETGGSPNPQSATSSAGARGYFQLMPGTFKDMGVGDNITDVDQNVHAGVKYLSQQLARYGGDWVKAAGAYNAGPGAMDAYLHVPGTHLSTETINYMRRVAEAHAEEEPNHPDVVARKTVQAQKVAQAAPNVPHPMPTATPSPQVSRPPSPQPSPGHPAFTAQEAGITLNPLELVKPGSFVDKTFKAGQVAAYQAIHAPLAAVDAILGAPQRATSAFLFEHPDNSTDLKGAVKAVGQGLGDAAYAAFHPNDERTRAHRDEATVQGTHLADSRADVDRAVDGIHAGPLTSAIQYLGHGANHVGRLFAAQILTDPLSLAPAAEAVATYARGARTLEDMSKAAHGVAGADGVFAPLAKAAKVSGAQIVRQGAQMFGRRPELDKWLEPGAKAARLGIEAKINNTVTQPMRDADNALLKANEEPLRNVTVTPDGQHDLPEPIRQRYLQEPYLYGTPSMREQALAMGYKPRPGEDLKPPANVLNYNLRDDYQTMIQPKAKFEDSDAFKVFQSTFNDGKAAFEHERKENGALGNDQYDIVANRLTLGRMFVSRRMVEEQTEKLFRDHEAQGGTIWKANAPSTNVGDLDHGAKRLQFQGWLGVPRRLAQMSSQSVMGNPLPHGLKNVGELTYLSGGATAFAKGTAYAAKGLDEAQRARMQNLGLSADYTRSIEGPLKRLGDKMVGAGGPLNLAARGGGAYIHGGQKVLDRLELGYRQALLDHYDDLFGPSENIMEEYQKADLVRRDLGDYKNVSLFVAGLQAIGGPFVAFRMGTVPSAVGRAIRRNPQRVENVVRAQSDENEDPNRQYDIHSGGPTDDAAQLYVPPIAGELAHFPFPDAPVSYMTSPATAGVIGQTIQNFNRDKEGYGQSAQSATAQLIGEYVPGAQLAESFVGLPYGKTPGVSPLHAALLSAFGAYATKRPRAKTQAQVKRRIMKAQ